LYPPTLDVVARRSVVPTAREILARFHANVRTVADCHVWTGSGASPRGGEWARVMIGRKMFSAARLAWRLRHNQWPPPGRRLLHSCGQKYGPCVNVNHLMLGRRHSPRGRQHRARAHRHAA
jgi:hypothetical protein